MIDIRKPIGWLFLIIGILVMGHGFYQPIATKCGALSINLNAIWGAVMLIFGIGMTALSRVK
jgi:hypothetical protein